jgi:hypothetical protein
VNDRVRISRCLHLDTFRLVQFRYCSSVTSSSQSTFLPSAMLDTAIWLIPLVVVAPCHCLTPGGVQMTSPGLISRFWPLSSLIHPVPDVTIRTCPAGCVCHAERAPGSKVTSPPVEEVLSFAAYSGSTMTDPVKF